MGGIRSMSLPSLSGPQGLQGAIWLPAAATVTSGEVLRLTGWSRQRLHNYRSRYDFPASGQQRRMRTRDVAAWLVKHGVTVEWL